MSFVYLTEPGVKLSKRGGHYIVSRQDEIIAELPQANVEGLVVMGPVCITAPTMMDLMQRKISVHWLSTSGISIGRILAFDQVNVERHLQQTNLMHSEFALSVQKRQIKAKLQNQRAILQRYNRKAGSESVAETIKKISMSVKKIDSCTETNKILGYEGSASKAYFSALGKLVPEEFLFEKRSRRPPADAFNAMLSFGYTLLMHEVYTGILNEGMHPYIGFMHEPKNHHPALASDLLEPWRPVIVDAMVMAVVHKKMITVDDFTKNGKGIFFTSTGKKKFIQAYEKKLHTVVDKKYSYRHMIAMQVGAYAEAMTTGNIDKFRPYVVR